MLLRQKTKELTRRQQHQEVDKEPFKETLNKQ